MKVLDLATQKKTETIHTGPAPYGLYNLPWLKEVWVHSWTNATFDVINTEGRTRTHKAVRAHIKPGWQNFSTSFQGSLFAVRCFNPFNTPFSQVGLTAKC